MRLRGPQRGEDRKDGGDQDASYVFGLLDELHSDLQFNLESVHESKCGRRLRSRYIASSWTLANRRPGFAGSKTTLHMPEFGRAPSASLPGFAAIFGDDHTRCPKRRERSDCGHPGRRRCRRYSGQRLRCRGLESESAIGGGEDTGCLRSSNQKHGSVETARCA